MSSFPDCKYDVNEYFSRLFYPKTVVRELLRLLTAVTDKNFIEGTGEWTSIIFV